MLHRSNLPMIVLLASLTAACADEDAPPSGDTEPGSSTGSDESTGDAPRQALYHDDVRPILAQHCVACHSEGAVGPFELDDYDEARAWGPALLESVESRTMPPFSMNNDGSCNTFHDARWLDDDEIDTLAAWALADYPEGDASLPAPAAPALATLDGSVATLSLPEYEPAVAEGHTEDYRCFLVELDLDAPAYVTGFDVLPGDPRLVHHVLGFRVDPGFLGNAAQMQALDDLDPDVPGWECYGAAGEDVFPGGVPVTWAPGAGATSYPEGVGVRFEPGDVLVVQMHYDLAHGGGHDATRVQLELADSVEREALQLLWDPFLFTTQFGGEVPELPPGQEIATYTWDDSIRQMLSFAVGDPDFERVEILGIIPHMHQRGLRMSVELQTQAGTQCGADLDRWDFDWQRTYFYEQPLSASIDDVMKVTCEWTTLDDEVPVRPGFGTADEMCLVGLMLAPM
jgi:mono/diheme cytochrome c family protein